MTKLTADSNGARLNGTSRRNFLRGGLAAAGTLLIINKPGLAFAAPSGDRTLKFHNLHTGENLTATYWENGEYLDDGLQEIYHILRDHRTGDVEAMDRELLDLLVDLRTRMDSNEPFNIISGYRSPKTNKHLRNASGGVAKKSLHMRGKAIDINLPGSDLNGLRKAARSLKKGGVGYYPKSGFIHVDTGRVRFW